MCRIRRGGKVREGLFLFFVFCLSIFSEGVSAADGEGFSVTPFYSNITIDQNDTQEGIDLQFTNHTSYDVIFKLSVADFGTLDETGGVAFSGSGDVFSNKYGLASWVVLQKDSVVLGKGEAQTVHVTVQNRDSLSPGGHYAAVVAKMDEASFADLQKNSSDVMFNPSFTSLIFARKLGGEIYDLELKEHTLARSFFGLPTITRLRFQNKGNVHVVPRGTVEVLDPFGKELQKGIINVDSGIVLPETFRVVPVSLLPIARAFFPGNYTMIIQYRFDGSDEIFLQQKTFFCIPPLFYGGISGAVFIFGFLAWLRKNKKKKNGAGKNKK